MFGHDGGNMGVMMLNRDEFRIVLIGKFLGKRGGIKVRMKVAGNIFRRDFKNFRKVLNRSGQGPAVADAVGVTDMLR